MGGATRGPRALLALACGVPRSMTSSSAHSMSPPTAVSGWDQFREHFWSGTLDVGGAASRSTESSSDGAAAPLPPLVSERTRRPSWSDSFAEFAENSFGRRDRTSSDGAAAPSPPLDRARRPSSDSSSKNDAWRALITDMEETNPEETASLSRQVRRHTAPPSPSASCLRPHPTCVGLGPQSSALSPQPSAHKPISP